MPAVQLQLLPAAAAAAAFWQIWGAAWSSDLGLFHWILFWSKPVGRSQFYSNLYRQQLLSAKSKLINPALQEIYFFGGVFNHRNNDFSSSFFLQSTDIQAIG